MEAENAQLIQQFNSLLEDMTREEERQIRSSLLKYLSEGTNTRLTLKLLHSLKGNALKSRGEVDRIGFKFLRYGVFFHKDVGKGRPIGRAGRKPRPWLNEPLDKFVPKVMDAVAANYVDRNVNAARILIK